MTKATENAKQELSQARKRIAELERRLADVALEASSIQDNENLYHMLFENAPGGLLLSNFEGRVIAANQTVLSELGYSKKELYGLTAEDIYCNPEDRVRLLSMLKQDGEINNYEAALFTRDKQILYCNIHMRVLQFQGGQFILTNATDITDLKLAQEASAHNARLYRTLFESANDAIFVMDGTRILDCNDRALKLFGRSRDEVIGKLVMDVSPGVQPDGKTAEQSAQQRIDAALAGEPQTFEWLHTLPDGSRLNAEVSITLIDSPTGENLLAHVRDITQRKQDQQSLLEAKARLEDKVQERTRELTKANEDLQREVEERKKAEETLIWFQRIISATPDLIALVDKDYVLHMVNDAYTQAYGLKHEDIIGKNVKEMIGTKDFKRHARPDLDRTFAGQTVQSETWVSLPTLGKRYFSFNYHPVYDETGQITNAAMAMHDITSSKCVQDALEESEKRFRSIFENNHAIMLILDPETGQIEDANHAAELFYGYTREQLLGMTIHDISQKDENELMTEMTLAKQEKRDHFESRHNLADDSVRDVEVFSGPVSIMGREFLYSIIHDITDRKIMEKELRILATLDPLTRANNRRFFMERVHEEIIRCKRYGCELTLLMLDIDHFKQINDRFGHDAGDETLQALTLACLTTLRETDIFGRMGGEEFAAALINTDADAGMEIAERLLDILSALEVKTTSGIVQFTVSIGVAPIFKDDISAEQTLKNADIALYEAKRSGRNRVVRYSTDLTMEAAAESATDTPPSS